MKNITEVLFFGVLSCLLSACSLIDTNKTNSQESQQQESTWDGKGYLKISLRKAGLMNTEYLFVGENGYHFDAKGKLDNGRDAVFTDNATWTSSDSEVFYSTGMGNFKALKDGTAIITATYGEFTDSYEVNVKTYATIKALTIPLSEYRTTRTYDFPIHIEPLNAFVIYTPSVEGAFDVLDDHKFIPRKPGVVDVTAKVFIAEDGRAKDFQFSLNIIDNDKPYFKYNDEVVEDLSVDIAVNKYNSFDVSSVGLSAFKGNNDEEISNSIYLKEGTVNTKVIGEYNVVLGVQNNNVESTLNLKVNIVEKEEVTTKIDLIEGELDSISAVVYENDKRTIHINLQTHLDDTYEKYSGEFVFVVELVAKKNVSGEAVPFNKTFSKYIDRKENGNFGYSFTIEHNADLRAGAENITINKKRMNFRGWGHNYITYPAE